MHLKFFGTLSLFILISFASWHLSSLYNKYLLILFMSFASLLGMYRYCSVLQNYTLTHHNLVSEKHDFIASITAIEDNDHPLYKQKISLSCSRYKTSHELNSAWVPFENTIALYTRKQSNLLVGDRVFMPEIQAKEITNESFKTYLIKENVATTLFVTNFTYTLIKRPYISAARYIAHLRISILKSLKRKLSPRTFQLFASIFLGNKPAPKDELEKSRDHFNTWGVMHYLARSGLHMVIFLLIWQYALYAIPLPFIYKQFLLISLIFLYCLLSWASISFIRAVLSVLLYKICFMARVPTNFLHILTMVCLVILLYNPMQLFFLDFQLSFGLTFALALFAHLQTAATHNY